MARPKRNNADYFSHDSSMRNDPKIKALRNKFGITGYAVYSMMLEVLTDSDFFKRMIDEIEIEILSADFGITAELFEEILAYMVRLRLLQTVDNCEYLSQKLTDRFQSVTDKRNNARKRVVSVTESPQSKVKHSKVKHSKAKQSKVNKPIKKIFTPPTIEEFKKYCDESGHVLNAETIYKGYDVADWHDSQGKQIKNWKQKILQVWCKEENKKGSQASFNLGQQKHEQVGQVLRSEEPVKTATQIVDENGNTVF